MGIVTFDWSQISWIGSPLMVPWWAEVQIFVGKSNMHLVPLHAYQSLGFVSFFWILVPILYYTNVS